MAKTERLYIRLTPEQKQQLQAAADVEHRTISNYVESLIENAVAEQEGAKNMTNDEIRAAAIIFAACYKATGSRNSCDITNAQMYPFRGASLYVQKLHAMHKATPDLDKLIAEQYGKISLDTMTHSFDVCATLEQQGVWTIAYSQYLGGLA